MQVFPHDEEWLPLGLIEEPTDEGILRTLFPLLRIKVERGVLPVEHRQGEHLGKQRDGLFRRQTDATNKLL